MCAYAQTYIMHAYTSIHPSIHPSIHACTLHEFRLNTAIATSNFTEKPNADFVPAGGSPSSFDRAEDRRAAS